MAAQSGWQEQRLFRGQHPQLKESVFLVGIWTPLDLGRLHSGPAESWPPGQGCRLAFPGSPPFHSKARGPVSWILTLRGASGSAPGLPVSSQLPLPWPTSWGQRPPISGSAVHTQPEVRTCFCKPNSNHLLSPFGKNTLRDPLLPTRHSRNPLPCCSPLPTVWFLACPPQQPYLALPSRPALIPPPSLPKPGLLSLLPRGQLLLPQSTGEILLTHHTPDPCANPDSSLSARRIVAPCRTGATPC